MFHSDKLHRLVIIYTLKYMHLPSHVGVYFKFVLLQVNKNYSYAVLWLFGNRLMHLGVTNKIGFDAPATKLGFGLWYRSIHVACRYKFILTIQNSKHFKWLLSGFIWLHEDQHNIKILLCNKRNWFSSLEIEILLFKRGMKREYLTL